MTEAEIKPKSKRYPSQEKYDRANPTITVRLKKDTKDLLDKCKGDLSQREMIRKLIVDNKDALQAAYDAGHDDGFIVGVAIARKEHEIAYCCNVCKKEIGIEPFSEEHKAVVNYLFTEGWGHNECHEKTEGEQTQQSA